MVHEACTLGARPFQPSSRPHCLRGGVWQSLQWSGLRIQGTSVWIFQGHNERQPEVAQNAVPGKSGRPRQFPSLRWHNAHTHEICAQGENKLDNPHGVLQGVVPTRRRVSAKSASFTPPIGVIEPSSLVDEDAEAVKAKAREERMEEDELQRMTEFDKPKEIQREVAFGDGPVFEELSSPWTVAHQPEPVVPTSASATVAEGTAGATLVSGVLPSGEMPIVLQPDPGLQVPQAPDDMPGPSAQISPRNSPTTRVHAVDVEEGEAKRAKVEDHKKQCIERLMAEQDKMIRTVFLVMKITILWIHTRLNFRRSMVMWKVHGKMKMSYTLRV